MPNYTYMYCRYVYINPQFCSRQLAEWKRLSTMANSVVINQLLHTLAGFSRLFSEQYLTWQPAGKIRDRLAMRPDFRRFLNEKQIYKFLKFPTLFFVGDVCARIG